MHVTWRRPGAGIVAGLSAVVALVGIVAAPASADVRSAYGYSTCGPGWGTNSQAQMYVRSDFEWAGLTEARINNTRAEGELWDCRTAYAKTGGTFRITSAFRAAGIRLESCSIPSGCTISGNQTIAQANYSNSGSNTTGKASIVGGGWRIYSHTTGYIDDYQHHGEIVFTNGGYQLIAAAGVRWYR